MSKPVPSPSMYGMMGLFGTLSEKSVLTVIFCPPSGTLMCWYMWSGSAAMRVLGEPSILVTPPVNRLARRCVDRSPPGWRGVNSTFERSIQMNKLLAALIAAAFAATGAFAADAKKEEAKPAAAASAASASKKEEKKVAKEEKKAEAKKEEAKK